MGAHLDDRSANAGDIAPAPLCPRCRLPEAKQAMLERLWDGEMAIAERILRKGNKLDVDGRQWPRLLEKLSTPGRCG